MINKVTKFYEQNSKAWIRSSTVKETVLLLNAKVDICVSRHERSPMIKKGTTDRIQLSKTFWCTSFCRYTGEKKFISFLIIKIISKPENERKLLDF